MKTTLNLMAGAAALLFAGVSLAQVPAGAPAGSTGLCKDGSYSSADVKKGACHGHKGVQAWYAPAAGAAGAATAAVTTKPAVAAPMVPPAPAAAAAAAAAPAAAPAAAAPAMPAAAPKAMAAATTPGAKPTAATAAPAPGGGPGLVWANSSSKVYHCAGNKYYGTTKQGAYMSEADAKAKGMHADHGKACS